MSFLRPGAVRFQRIGCLVFAGVLLLVNAGCWRQSLPTDQPEVVRIGVDRAFVVPPPYSARTQPHWWTGKDLVPRFPEVDITTLPIRSLGNGFWVSEILERPDLIDKGQLSKDYVGLSVSGDERPFQGLHAESRQQGSKIESHKSFPGAECFVVRSGEYQSCLLTYKGHELVVHIDPTGRSPNPSYRVSFRSEVYGVLNVLWYTSERNFAYWPQIQDAAMQRIEQWRYDVQRTKLKEANRMQVPDGESKQSVTSGEQLRQGSTKQ